MTYCDKFGIINPYYKGDTDMDSFEPKKLALIRILNILETYTDCNHPLTHDEIVKTLYTLYGIRHRNHQEGFIFKYQAI